MILRFECVGQKTINVHLLDFRDRTVDASPAFSAIAELMRAETAEQFESEGGHASGGWKPLKPATVKAKQHGGFRPNILQRTGSLLDSLTVKDDPNQIVEVGPLSLRFGTRVSYAVLHQTGTGHMPARQPLAFTEQARRNMTTIMQRWLVAGDVEHLGAVGGLTDRERAR
jgi:phage gpG-like protein